MGYGNDALRGLAQLAERLAEKFELLVLITIKHL